MHHWLRGYGRPWVHAPQGVSFQEMRQIGNVGYEL